MSVEAKAIRLLATAAVQVVCDEGQLRASVRGDHGTYDVRLTRRGPECSCPSWRRRCSHQQAVALVTGWGDTG